MRFRRPSTRGRTRPARWRSSTCASPPTTHRSSSSCIRSSPRRPTAERRTSTSNRRPTKTGGSGTELRVRMRIDGVLSEQTRVPKRMVAGVVSRIKIMADLDISERRIPQDGRVGLTVDGRHIDIRAVTIPSVHGESVVLRILDKDNIRLELDKMGMQKHELDRFRRGVHPRPRRRARHRADRFGQVNLALRRAARAQHAGEEHHHDRGPGRVPDRRASLRFRSTRRPASGLRRACAR